MTRHVVVTTLERWSSTLYLVAGGLLIGNATLLGYEAFVEAAAPEDVFGPPGFFIGLLGLVGLYAALADQTPLVARVGAGLAVIATVGWAVILPFSVGGEFGLLTGQQLPFVVIVGTWVSMILSYALSSAASLHTGVPSRTVGLLLLAPAVLVLSVIVAAGTIGASAIGAFIIGSGQALAHVAIGYSLRSSNLPMDRTASRTDAIR